MCVQMIGDDSRGWAWTRVLQGLPAQEIHLCGDASAIKLVEQLTSEMGETVEVLLPSFLLLHGAIRT